jgi:hypothetical protein
MAISLSTSFSSASYAHKIAISVSAKRPVYFFLDYSNIAISAQDVGWLSDGHAARHSIRLHARNLRALAQRNRDWKFGFAAAGLHATCPSLCRHFEEASINIHVSERGNNSNREQNVDERIQYEMLRLTKKCHERGTVVLATGDGAGSTRGEGFHSVLENLLEHGYSIELLSWKHSLNSDLRLWVETHGRYIALDSFYQDITFIEGGREATGTHVLNRKIAKQGLIH